MSDEGGGGDKGGGDEKGGDGGGYDPGPAPGAGVYPGDTGGGGGIDPGIDPGIGGGGGIDPGDLGGGGGGIDPGIGGGGGIDPGDLGGGGTPAPDFFDPGPRFTAQSLAYDTSAPGSSGTPDIGALNATIANFPGSEAFAMATPGTGPSAAGTIGGGAGGGGGDLTSGGWDESGGWDLKNLDTPNVTGSNNTPQWSADGSRYLGDPSGAPAGDNGLPGYNDRAQAGSSSSTGSGNSNSFMDSLKISNPIGSAIAAGGLANALINGQRPSGTEQQLAELARQNMASSQNLVGGGKEYADQGNADLRARAVSTDPNATTLMDRGTGLTGYVGTGKLPDAVQAQLNQAKSDATAQIVSKWASRGMPTDPAKNSGLRAELQDLDRRTIAQGESMAAELAKSGLGIISGGADLNKASGGFEKSAADLGTQLVSSGVTQSGIAGTTFAKLAELDAARNKRTSDAISAMAAALSGTSAKPKITIG